MNVCSIVARNYLAQARVLAQSFAAHHPGRRLSVLVVDAEVGEPFTEEEAFELVTLSDLPLPAREHRTMAGIYDVTELSTALKPWLLLHLLERGEAVVYLDPDIEIFAPLDELDETVLHGVVLIPHTLAPIPRDGRRPSAEDIARAGVYNLGFVAVPKEAEPFLRWWGDQLRRDCVVAFADGLFVDQRLIDFLPAYYDHHVLRDPTYNVAYWNLHERDVEWTGSGFEVEGDLFASSTSAASTRPSRTC